MTVWARIALAELALSGAEAAACGAPIALWLAALPDGAGLLRGLAPIALALWIALVLRMLDTLRPVVAVAAARGRQQAVSPEDAEAAQRALGRAPREAAALRLVYWAALVAALAALAFRRGLGDPAAAAALAGVVVVHAGGGAAARALGLEWVLAGLRPALLPHVEGIRIFAAGYRTSLLLAGLAVLGAAHAALVFFATAFAGLEPADLARESLLLAPTLVAAAVLWVRSLLRRTAPLDEYLAATLRAQGTRGPARDDPRAVAAFRAAQSLPYRLAGYEAFSLVLAGVLAVAAGRRLAGVDVSEAARLLGVLAVVGVAALLYQALLLRAALRPLIRHLGSRHALPVAEIRSRVGLRPKLLACFLGVGGVACGTLALFAGAPGSALALAALGGGLALSLGLTLLVVREVIEPLRALEGRSEEMARGELARPVPPSGEADEIGRLTVAFEEMRRSLRDRLRSTESINIDLEREVRRRTEALEQRNAELREALDKLRRAQDDLVRSEKLASMGRLVAGIAHEINNPVNALINSLGPLEELIRQLPRAAPAEVPELVRAAEEMLAVVHRGAARTKAIVQALHNYSRGDEAVQREVSIARSVDDTLDLLRHRLRQVRVDKQIDPAARILGFPGQIDQVLMNLITNAAQAIGDRGGTIRLQGGVEDGRVVLVVADDGPGIPPEILPRIFDPFFTTKDVGEGSGLGLSIVHGIVERHGGRIDVDSAPGRGTTFRLSFPAAGAQAPDGAGQAQQQRAR